MSAAAPRERLHPRRGALPHKLHKTPWPWHDRSGRFSWLKTSSLLLMVLPGAWLAYGLAAGQLGARPITAAIHQTGYWAVRFLLLSLMASPARAIFNWHRVVLIRRQLGLAALFYALAHVALYACDQNWQMQHVASEMLHRFYLEVGLVALTGLAVLGVTSTDQSLRRMGHDWRRLHRLVYPVAAIGLFHFFLQSKADAGQAVLMSGLFVWMLAWRLLPSGPDRAPAPILALSAAAAMLTVALEAAWYGLATNIAWRRPVLAELNISYGPQPAGQVLLIGLCLTVATALFWAQHRERLRRTAVFNMALYGGGALIVALLAFSFSLTDDYLPMDWNFWQAALGFVAVAAAFGIARWTLPIKAATGRRVLDGICIVLLALPIAAGLIS